MKMITKEMLAELIAVNEGPCLSVYLPTHRSHPENAQDPIRFKNLVKELEASLQQGMSTDEAAEVLAPFQQLVDDVQFWNHTLDGLAVLGAPGRFNIIGLPLAVEPLAIVADSLHTKPLRKYLQSVDRFQVLGISLHDMQLFEGNRHALYPVEHDDTMPLTIKQALGEELTEQHLTVASYGGVGGTSGDMVHGHGGRKDELDKDAERYFRVVAREVNERYSKPSGLPLILAALAEHHTLFKKVSNNPQLLSDGITMNYKALEPAQLAAMAWQVMEPEYISRLKQYGEDYGTSKARQLADEDIGEVAANAAQSRIDTLLVEANRLVPGRITDLNTGKIEPGDLDHPETDDLLDDIAELVVRMGGKVKVIPAEYMPTDTGVAAIYRY